MSKIEQWINDLKPLLDEMSSTDLSELEWEKEGYKIKIVRSPVERRKQDAVQAEKKPATRPVSVKSPVVGTFHFIESKPEIGSHINKGQSIGHINSINVKHGVEMETSGKLVEIHVEEGQAVEFGQLLFTLEENVS